MLNRLVFPRAQAARSATQDRRRRGPRLAVALAALALVPQASTALPSFQAPAAQAPSRPALWVVSDRDTIVYLFGTFHALDDRTHWFGHSVKAAFDASDELVLETIVPEDPAELHAALARTAMASAPVPGAPVVAGGAKGSFAASANQAMATGRKVGMSVEQGADAVLKRAADRSGKPVAGLESFEEQLTMFRSLSAGGPSTSGAAASPPPGAVAQMLLQMQSAWHRGDGSRFAAMLAGIEAQSPVTYQRLFADRNANWARWIAGRLDQPGIVFVAVGTGHLIGRDSVQNKLAQRGINSARIS